MASKAKVGLPSISSVQIVGAKIMVPMISSPSASWRGSDSIRVLLFSLTLRSGRAILRYNPRLLSSWPTSSTDAPRLRSIVEAVESSFRLRLQPVLAVHQLNNRARYERFMVGSAASLHEPDFQLGGSTLHRHQ